MSQADAPVSELRIEQQGSLARAVLDRPRALNSLTDAMRQKLAEGLRRASRDANTYAVAITSTHAKAFSVGSDVREVAAWGREDLARARRAFRDEYGLNWHCECFSKPTVSLIGGMVMGGGVGVSLYGTHRVAGEGYRFAMPETKIGLFPDVGVCHAFSRMPDSIGMYLGLTGNAIGRADAYALGLVTHCIPSARFAEIEAEIADVQPVDTVLDTRHEEPGPGELDALRETIASCFSAGSVGEIVDRLKSEKGANAAFAAETAAALATRAPLSLAITHRHITAARDIDLKRVLEIDYRLACRCLDGHDFYEGVRALIIDKDNAPRWQPGTIGEVSEADVEAWFSPLADGEELILPERSEMQAARI